MVRIDSVDTADEKKITKNTCTRDAAYCDFWSQERRYALREDVYMGNNILLDVTQFTYSGVSKRTTATTQLP